MPAPCPTRTQALWQRPLRRLPAGPLQRFVQSIPKVELHRHLEGDIDPADFAALARTTAGDRVALDPKTAARLIQMTGNASKERSLDAMIARFDTIGLAFTGRKAIVTLTRRALERCATDHLEHVELRFSPMFMATAHHLDPRAVIEAVLEGVRAASARPSSVGLVLIVERHLGLPAAAFVEGLAEAYHARGVVGLDLANDELRHPPAPFAPVFRRAKAAGLGVTVHAGEAAGPGNIRDAVELLQADRIGHAVSAQTDPGLLKMLRSRGVVLEACPTSNLRTGAVNSLSNHPLFDYLRDGQRVTLNTDDPAAFGTSLSEEFQAAIQTFDLTIDDVRKLVMNAVDGAFLNPTERRALRSRVEKDFDECERRLASEVAAGEARDAGAADEASETLRAGAAGEAHAADEAGETLRAGASDEAYDASAADEANKAEAAGEAASRAGAAHSAASTAVG